MSAEAVASGVVTERGWPPWVRLAWASFVAQHRHFWRHPAAAFFVLALPMIMLVLFGALLGREVDVGFGPIPAAQFYTPQLACFAVASAALTRLTGNLANQRQFGFLKRVLGCPMPPSAYLTGAVLVSVWIAMLGTFLTTILGVAAYDVGIEAAKIPTAVVAFLVGTFAFAGLGLALAAIAPSAESAPAMAMGLLLPMAFISDVFIPAEDPPTWLAVLADIFPLKHFSEALSAAFHPAVAAPGFQGEALAILAAWGVFGSLVAIRRFDWSPRTRTRRRRRAAAPAS